MTRFFPLEKISDIHGKLLIKTLAKGSNHFPREIQKVEWLPTKQLLHAERNENGLVVSLPETNSDSLSYANVIKIYS